MNLPIIENVVEKEEPKQIDIYCPRDLKEDTILAHVATFLKTMTEWESLDTNYRAIGFNPKKE
jgi:hypothetical protein